MGFEQSEAVPQPSEQPLEAADSQLIQRRAEYVKLVEQSFFDLREGTKYYGIPKEWLNVFLRGPPQEAAALGPINTSSILDHTELCINPATNPEFVAEQVFAKLVEWYGVDGPFVERQLFMDKKDGQLKLETYPLYIIPHLLCNNPETINRYRLAGAKPFLISALSTARDLKLAVKKQFEIGKGTTRIWRITPATRLPVILTPQDLSNITSKTLIPAGKKSGSIRLEDLNISERNILIEIQQEDGTYPMDTSSTVTLGSGLVGLNNLGNTCYMNSALQCLVHIPELTNYFLYDYYEKEINRDNPLGNDGKVASAYAGLVKHLFDKRFAGPSSSFSPRDFKYTIGYYNSMFADYHQQDSQELIAFLLDGLHEDLNRILKKPYVEKPELPDDKVNDLEEVRKLAQKCWDSHKLRNNSVVIDLFVGLYKSTLVCPSCGKISITFDPYNDLTLPLPVHKKWIGKVNVLLEEGYPKSLEVELPKSATFADLKVYVADKVKVPINELLAVEVFQSQVYKNFEAKDSDTRYLPISDLIGQNDEIWFHQIKHRPGDLIVPVFNTLSDSRNTKPFGIPFFITVTEDECYSFGKIRRKLEQRYSQLSTFNFFGSRQRLQHRATEFPGIEDGDDDDVSLADPEIPGNYAFSVKVFDSSHELKISNRYGRGLYGYSRYPQEDEEDDSLWIPRTHNNFKGLPDLLEKVEENKRRFYLYGAKSTETVTSEDSDPGNPGDGADETNLMDSDPSEQNLAPLTEEANGMQVDDDEKEEQQDSESELESIARPLIFEKNALVCEWEPTFFDTFFTGIEEDGLGGRETWSNPEILENAEVEENKRLMAESRRKNISLDNCMEMFSNPEVLGENDLWYCPNCKEHRQATKKIEIWSVPDILTIHLKRFENTKSFSDKIDAVVEFPIEGLDMSKYVVDSTGEEMIYDLFAVDNHFGGLGGGHYTAYAKNFVDGKWYYFDDSRVSVVDPTESIRGSAYLLFYRKRSSEPLGGEFFRRMMGEIGQRNAENHKRLQESVKQDALRADSIDESPTPMESLNTTESGTSATTTTDVCSDENEQGYHELKSERSDETESLVSDNLIKRRKKMLGDGHVDSTIGSPASDVDDNVSTFSGNAVAPADINDGAYGDFI
ncbi:hypothetical protein KL918_000669 [Ogataea parapolymorpha]|uniref:ubiquitinyl hydrolase 1 n=1 Tax=Ogataea parapolymorpha (strain ATCC 26012 / BCRC 20466 / JCM 22074 / NRRL Y-7560 / DL-1) TaxID=871575 RepID=W1Q9N0_OGAPD|nr:Ubiquitin carboxyl-terminal hydrolase [Ogataea parapolymorpha DL-1]ESW97058.1 Ubiquitin carboxyl-terminal hydrolase [Ogataea parapolymorpha DL-1]KAG7869124.1 hypothetical protein KL918_000669 [Ogataea parapolymorpha]KAG7875825.1 hypothetical protein KL916_000496 [Ogataea parapolymorpha]